MEKQAVIVMVASLSVGQVQETFLYSLAKSSTITLYLFDTHSTNNTYSHTNIQYKENKEKRRVVGQLQC